ncbi:MAG: NADH-quinone oxidoreductase subunit J [Phycisphaerales bacterium]|nr:NADH-quinone oxidoreductase subunit J [Phycisphaerales bacterium]
MEAIIHPIVVYAGLAVGAVGVAMAMPRPRVSPQVIGALLAAVGFGVIFLFLGLRAGRDNPGVFFYLFSLIGLGSALRVITHPRPVYAALYFILTILSSSALYLLMQAEFMAFALIIIYAGAILITYLFVIMLATQAPTEEQVEALSEYDAFSREPVVATAVGFILLGVLTGVMARGIQEIRPASGEGQKQAALERMPGKIIESLRSAGAFEVFLEPTKQDLTNAQQALVNWTRGEVSLRLRPDGGRRLAKAVERPEFAALFGGADPARAAADNLATASDADVVVRLPSSVKMTNIEGIGWDLIAKHPMALELAGVILLMAMLGAVVLARKQIEIGEAEKAQAAAGRAGGVGIGGGGVV